MKRISLLLLVVVLAWSCSKEDDTGIQDNNTISQKQVFGYPTDNFDPPRTYEGLRSCYNQYVRDGVQTFNEKFGYSTGKSIKYISGGNVSQVIPLFKGEKMENVLWINEEYYLLINRAEELSPTGAPKRPYSKIFGLSRASFLSGNSSILHHNFAIQNSINELTITEATSTVTPGQIYAKSNTPCSHWEDEWLLIYYNFFGLIPPVGGDLPDDVIEFATMNEIINSVTGGDCVCPIPCLVIKALNEHPGVMQSAKDLVNQNWVMNEYGLGLSTVLDIEQNLLVDLVAFECRPTNITDPCTDESIPQGEIINALFNSSPYLTSEGFYNALSEDNDWIIETDRFKNCDLLKCLFDLLREDADVFWCDVFDQFDNMFNDLVLDVGGDNFTPDPFVVNPDRNGVTGLNNDGVLAITFNPELCESDEETDILRVLKTILHEGLHADMYQYVSENLMPGQTLSSIDQSTFNDVFDGLFELVCEDTNLTDQHQQMMNSSIELIASALHAFNNGIGNVEDYEYLAWLGIWRDDPCVESVISLVEINALRDLYEANVTLSPSISCD